MNIYATPALQRKANVAAPRVLIVRVGAMGDVFHALPAVAMLRDALPDAHIGWAIEPRWAPLLRAEGATARDPERMPLVDAVHIVEAKAWNKRPFSPWTMGSILKLWRALRAERYDIAVDLQGTLRSAVIARLSGAPAVIGSAAPRESIARTLYRTAVQPGSTHVTDQAAELIEAALRAFAPLGERTVAQDAGQGAREAHASGTPLLPRDEAAEAWWKERRSTLYGEQPLVLLAATAGWGAKEWPPRKFAKLAIRLAGRGYRVLLNAPPGKVDSVTLEAVMLARDLDRVLSWNVVTLPATLPQLIAATREMRAVIAGDTGPLHLATALGIPTVGLFGPTDPKRTGPRQPRSINLRDPASVTSHRRHTQTEAGLARIAVQDVLHAVERVTAPQP